MRTIGAFRGPAALKTGRAARKLKIGSGEKWN
jgi:hypothetical protein